MNKLSIILSMFVAVAVAAIAAVTAGPSPKAASDPTQGYWITLSQVQQGLTSYEHGDICYLSVVNNQYYPVNTVKEDVPSNTSYWHAEPVANNDQAFYLVDNNRRYLSVSLDKIQESDDQPLVYFYKTAVTSTQAQAAYWSINLGSGITSITLAGVPASMQATIDKIELPNEAPDNIYLSMSQKNATVHMSEADGTFPQWDPETVGTLTTDWTLTTAEERYDAAFDAAETRINTLFGIPALWNNEQANERARQTIEAQRTNYTALRGASARPATAIASMQTVMNQAYNTVYSSVTNKVITLQDNSGFLSTDGKALSYTNANGLDMLWTLTYSGGGFVIQNQTEGCYIALIPEKLPSYDPYYQPIPGVPAHFGVASQPTVFSFVPDNGGIKLFAGEQPFYLTDYANDQKLESDPANASLFTPAEMTATDVQQIVLSDANSQFAQEKASAEAFLQTLSVLANTPEQNIYDFAAESLANLTGTITVGPNTTAMQVLAEAKRQLGMIASVVNEASLTPALIESTANGTTKYLSASSASRQIYNEYGNLVTVSVPDARMTGLDATARGHRLATALWAFEYVSAGQFRLINSEGLYLSAPHYDSEVQENVNATTEADDATLFTLANGQFEYTDGTNTGHIQFTTGGVTFDTFAMGDPTTMPQPTDATTDADGVVIPDANVSYYQIASIGGGGVITGVLPGDALTHSSSSIGSYWWIEIDNNDPINNNAFIIHSIYPGYYLGADLRLSDTPCTWYLNENGIQPSTSGNVNNVFNGYNAGLVISTTPANNRGNVIAAAPYTTAGDANPALQTARFANASWQLQSWMFVEAQSASSIVTDYVNNNLSWQLRAVEDGINNISSMSPFGSNSLSLAISLLDEFKTSIGYNGGSVSISDEAEALQAILDFNNIMARVQTEFDQEVIEGAPGACVKIVNEGRSFADYSANIFLAGAGSNLSFVDFADDTPASEWHIAANSTRGITFTNGNRQSLGAPSANGTVTGATGTYRLSLDIWWDVLEESDGNFYSTGTTSPWYAVPEALLTADPSTQEDYYNMSVKSGLGMENVQISGIGLAARGGESDLLCGSDLNNVYSQWSFRIHNPAPSGIDQIENAGTEAEEVALYDIRGQRVIRANAAPGIYLSRRSDGSMVKVIIR